VLVSSGAVGVALLISTGDPFDLTGLEVRAHGEGEDHGRGWFESIVADRRQGSIHPQCRFQILVCCQPMSSVGVVALGALITGDAEQGGADGSPRALRQSDGGEGGRIPGGHEVRCG